ncbi:heavy metal-binding domain-containing protein [Hymenobacter sp. NBH84]|uniref:heavy metal-binding domain-containing protein n=1 Tax=Hymenobacter defluvii TaxID=2054411 RepID=UPI001CA5DD2A
MDFSLGQLMLRPATGLLLGAMLLLGACQSEPATTAAPANTEAVTPAHTAAYVCPMGCQGSESNKPGKCPVCEMDLVANQATPATE